MMAKKSIASLEASMILEQGSMMRRSVDGMWCIRWPTAIIPNHLTTTL
ncbi:hypothetical protein [Sphingobacterium faecium]|nr:hypothetical protein [Sphingobacterium faecium]